MILDLFIAFSGGALYEAACVAWVHYSERGDAGCTALAGMLCAAAQVAGIGESVHTWVAAPFFIAGYGVGTWGAVKFKSRNKPNCIRTNRRLDRRGDAPVSAMIAEPSQVAFERAGTPGSDVNFLNSP